MSVLVRDARESDMAHVQQIYAPHVLKGVATFEEVPPPVEELVSRWLAVLKGGLPWLVAELSGDVVGYAYATPYRARPAYRYTIENSVYVRDGLGGRGIGSALMKELLVRCESGPWRQMVAVIGGSDNHASIKLHRSLGFEAAGTLRSVGFKHGRWVDTVLMQRPLSGGAESLP